MLVRLFLSICLLLAVLLSGAAYATPHPAEAPVAMAHQ